MDTLLHSISLLFLLVLQGWEVRGEWRVSVDLVTYTAPARTAGSHSCDHAASPLHAECDPVFHVCQGNGHNLTCSTSRPYNDTHSIAFGQEGTALLAPHVFTSMPGHYTLDVKVMDSDPGHNVNTVHFSRKSFPKTMMVSGAVIPVILQRNNYTLVLTVVVQCNPPSVGPSCNCTPSSNQLCNATTGQHYCAPGYTGHGCRHSNTSCHVSTCYNGGSCEETSTGFLCHCDPGFTGQHCQTNLDDCAAVRCHNGGTCMDGVSGFVCQCGSGFMGPLCQTALNASGWAVGCENGGSLDTASNTCHCPSGYTGRTCDIKLSGCLLHQCQHGGRCKPLSDSSYTCLCSYGYSGAFCQTDDTHPCSSFVCRHGGTCHSLLGTPYCHCSPGYKGERCEVRADECVSSPCMNGGVCRDGVNSFLCECRPGFVGHRCEIDSSKQSLVG